MLSYIKIPEFQKLVRILQEYIGSSLLTGGVYTDAMTVQLWVVGWTIFTVHIKPYVAQHVHRRNWTVQLTMTTMLAVSGTVMWRASVPLMVISFVTRSTMPTLCTTTLSLEMTRVTTTLKFIAVMSNMADKAVCMTLIPVGRSVIAAVLVVNCISNLTIIAWWLLMVTSVTHCTLMHCVFSMSPMTRLSTFVITNQRLVTTLSIICGWATWFVLMTSAMNLTSTLIYSVTSLCKTVMQACIIFIMMKTLVRWKLAVVRMCCTIP